MDWTIPLVSLTGGILFGAMSPGPSFIVVARAAISQSRLDGLATAFGMAVSGALFASAGVLGLVVLLASVPILFLCLKIMGAGYLFFLAYTMWSSAHKPLIISKSTRHRRGTVCKSFMVGLITGLSNPKMAIVYTSIFAVALPAEYSNAFAFTCVALIFLVEILWYSIVVFVFSANVSRAKYYHYKAVIDRTAAGVMSLLGARVLYELR